MRNCGFGLKFSEAAT